MNRFTGLILALVMAVSTACASAGTGDAGADGDRPRDNAHTRSAGVHLARAATSEGEEAKTHYEAALADAHRSITEAPTNAKGYLLAGQAAVGVGDWVQADTMFVKAQELYPGYAEQIVSEREQGWVAAYNQGVEAVQTGDVEAALALFEAADRQYRGRQEARMNMGWAHMRLGNTEGAIEAYRVALDSILWGPPADKRPAELAAEWEEDEQIAAFNLAQLLGSVGRYEEAAATLERYMQMNEGTLDAATELSALSSRAQYLAQAGRAEEAEALYQQLLARTDLTSSDYFQIGVGYFNTGDHAAAADAFAKAAELNPYSRDALINLVQSNYAESLEVEKEPSSPERNARLLTLYDGILERSDQVRAFDPLNRNLISFMLRAYRGKSDMASGAEARQLRERMAALFTVHQNMPWEVSEVAINVQDGGQVSISGDILNVGGRAGAPVALRFTIIGDQGQALGTETVTITAPEQGAAQQFQAQISVGTATVAGWKYELVE